jgi:serine/threonine protein kinase
MFPVALFKHFYANTELSRSLSYGTMSVKFFRVWIIYTSRVLSIETLKVLISWWMLKDTLKYLISAFRRKWRAVSAHPIFVMVDALLTLIDPLDIQANRHSQQGTVFWMAPEVVKGTSYTHKVDIWSVGCLVVEMITGLQPWAPLKPEQVIYKVHRTTYSVTL